MRLVSLAASNTEIVHALGCGHWLVGVDDYSDFPSDVRSLPRVGRDLDIDVERVARLKPDLVLASLSVPGMERNIERLRASRLPFLVVPSTGLTGVFSAIVLVGEALGRSEAARELVGRLRERLDRVSEKVASESPVRVYWEWWPRPPISPCRTSWITDLLPLAGGYNVFADLDGESREVALDDVLARTPEAAVLCWCGARKLPDPRALGERPGWDALPAVRSGRVYAVLEPLYGRPGPRLVDGVEELARLLHPGLWRRAA